MQIRHFDSADDRLWDDVVATSWDGTPLHSRRFLNYHGGRFKDRSVVVTDDAGRLLGVMPAAEDPAHPERLVSHPGSPFGGLLQRGDLLGPHALEAMERIRAFYAGFGYRTLRYKATPLIYHAVPYQDDLYALFRLGAQRWRTDLCAVIDTKKRLPLSRNRRAGLRHAAAAGVSVDEGHRYLPAVWDILERQLEERFRARPTHTLPEIQDVAERLGDKLHCRVALLQDEVVAGLVLFTFPPVLRAQYSAADNRAREVSALDWLFEATIIDAGQCGFRYVDFGSSNTDDGQTLNPGLYRYKTGLGAGSVAHDMFDLDL